MSFGAVACRSELSSAVRSYRLPFGRRDSVIPFSVLNSQFSSRHRLGPAHELDQSLLERPGVDVARDAPARECAQRPAPGAARPRLSDVEGEPLDAPLLGGEIKQFLLGGPEIGQITLVRFHALHVIVIPAMLALLISLHVWRVRKDGGLAANEGADGE